MPWGSLRPRGLASMIATHAVPSAARRGPARYEPAPADARAGRETGGQVRQPLPARAPSGQQTAQGGDVRRGSDAPGRRGNDPRRPAHAQPRDVRDDLDGARGPPGDRRGAAGELHRSRRVPAVGRDRAALHPHARRPLQRPRRDDRRAYAGLLRGDHARRALAEVEVARAPRGRRQGDRSPQPRLRRRRARRLGEVLPLLRRRAAHRPARARQVHDRPRGRRAARRREHDRRRRRARHHLHRARRRHLTGSTTCS